MNEKLKKYLMEHKKMSEADADKHLASLSKEDEEKLSGEVDAEMKRMSEEKEKEEKLAAEQKEKELSAKRAELTKLHADFRASQEKSAMLARKGTVMARLSRLKASAKITPAEIKKLSTEDLAKKTDAELSSFFEGYEKREPQVILGLVGDARAVDVSKVVAQKRLSKLEQEMRQNMPLSKRVAELSAKDPTKTRLSEEMPLPGTPAAEQSGMRPEEEALAIEKMMDQDINLAKEMFREYCRKMQMRSTDGATDGIAVEQEKSSEELASTVATMQTQMEQIQKLSAEISGVKL